jgi:hypothetical protein
MQDRLTQPLGYLEVSGCEYDELRIEKEVRVCEYDEVRIEKEVRVCEYDEAGIEKEVSVREDDEVRIEKEVRICEYVPSWSRFAAYKSTRLFSTLFNPNLMDAFSAFLSPAIMFSKLLLLLLLLNFCNKTPHETRQDKLLYTIEF